MTDLTKFLRYLAALGSAAILATVSLIAPHVAISWAQPDVRRQTPAETPTEPLDLSDLFSGSSIPIPRRSDDRLPNYARPYVVWGESDDGTLSMSEAARRMAEDNRRRNAQASEVLPDSDPDLLLRALRGLETL
ncbi:hypothetical protein AB0I72_27310 [Nocardiopsis sp. NPDC049922]|uniref:hypothetical protein n=1 Tax=Nocardiopsis sp. NPDC049922 TaxID=3155157 RepID=UPI0033FD9ECA